MSKSRIRIGIGGWTYEPWRGIFYPKGLRQTDELEFAASRLGAIEINGTYYRLQKPESFAKWADAAPQGFQFTIKGSRFCTNRRVLAEAGESVAKFCGQGLTELGDKLGPLFWQFMETKQFDPPDFGAFLALLPGEQDGVKLRHAVEVRHESFACADFVALCREHEIAIVFGEKEKFPTIADQTADFSYARLQRAREGVKTGYPTTELDHWAEVAKSWRAGEKPRGIETVGNGATPGKDRDVYIFMINGAKVRAPAAAEALIARLRT